jgi:hypothetical protein
MHVTVSIIERLPVPVLSPGAPAFLEISALAVRLSRHPLDRAAAATLQARVARLYGLDAAEFRHVVGTFPLVPIEERDAALSAFADPGAANPRSSMR